MYLTQHLEMQKWGEGEVYNWNIFMENQTCWILTLKMVNWLNLWRMIGSWLWVWSNRWACEWWWFWRKRRKMNNKNLNIYYIIHIGYINKYWHIKTHCCFIGVTGVYVWNYCTQNMLFNHQIWVCVKALNLLIGAIALRVPLAGDVQQSGWIAQA